METKKPLATVENVQITSKIKGNHLYPVFEGVYSKVTLGKEFTGKVAVKAIPCQDTRDSFANELSIFALKSHKHIVECLDLLQNVELGFGEFKNKKYNLIVLEYLSNKDLFEFVSKSRLGEPVARFYFEQILDGIEYLHDQGFVHRDLKLENILVDSEFNLKLTDFGYCVKHSDESGPILFQGTGSISTEDIMPPEYYEGSCYYGQDMEIFALGKLLMSMVLGITPFMKASKEDKLYSVILSGTWHLYWRKIDSWIMSNKLGSLSPAFKGLIEQMLDPSPKFRIKLQDIRKTSWFLDTKCPDLEEVKQAMMKIKEGN